MSVFGKIVMWGLVIAALAVGAIWILGGKQNEYSAGVAINAKPETVFVYLTSPEHHKSWAYGLMEVSQYSPIVKSDLGVPPSKTQRVFKDETGKEVQFEDQVIRFEQNSMLTVQSTNNQTKVTRIFQLEPKDGQTYLVYRVKTVNLGLGRLLAPLAKDETQSRIDSEIRKLKEVVESSSNSAVPTGGAGSFTPPSVPSGDSTPDQPASGQTFSF